MTVSEAAFLLVGFGIGAFVLNLVWLVYAQHEAHGIYAEMRQVVLDVLREVAAASGKTE